MKCHVTDYEDDDGPHSCTRPNGHTGDHACGCGYQWHTSPTTEGEYAMPGPIDDFTGYNPAEPR